MTDAPVRLDDPWRKVAFYFLRKLPDATELPVFSANDAPIPQELLDAIASPRRPTAPPT